MQLTSPSPVRRAFWQKQIPVLAGLAVLVIALVAGLVMFGGGLGVFAPRATPQTMPKQVKITNVSDKAFTVSFYTDEATVGFVKYGVDAATLKTQASDDRDQLTGSVGKFSLHHITVKGLKPNTPYFFTLGTGSGASFDNNGAPFMVKTASDPGTPPPVAKTVYGNVMTAGGTPAEGSLVYLVAEGGGELSAVVKASGSWAISLASARVSNGSGYLSITDATAVVIFIQGTPLSQTSQITTTVQAAQPLADISLGKVVALDAAVTPEPTLVEASPSSEVSSAIAPTASISGQPAASVAASLAALGTVPTASTSAVPAATPSAVLNLEQLAVASSSGKTITVVPDPQIVGVAAPAAKVRIEIHSEVEITQTVTADANGNFTLDISQFQDLEPGEHTITYSYTDPATGKEVTKTQTFMVAAKQLALAPLGASATTTPTPKATATPTLTPTPTKSKTSTSSATYGSGNPYPISTASTDTSTRSTSVATTSGAFKTGSVGATLALIGGGCFLMLIGWWSWWLAGQVREERG